VTECPHFFLLQLLKFLPIKVPAIAMKFHSYDDMSLHENLLSYDEG